jgi:hypothetical protein
MRGSDAVKGIKEQITVDGKPLRVYLKTLEERARYVRDKLDALDLLRFAGILVAIACMGKALPPDDPLQSYDILALVGYWMRPPALSEDPAFL